MQSMCTIIILMSSVWPSVQGWKVVDLVSLVSNSVQRLDQNVLRNLLFLYDIMVCGIQKCTHTRLSKSLAFSSIMIKRCIPSCRLIGNGSITFWGRRQSSTPIINLFSLYRHNGSFRMITIKSGLHISNNSTLILNTKSATPIMLQNSSTSPQLQH